MKKHFRTLVKITLVLIYLVIFAGATVRMTGSGMGCPDWPKCFGYYIPPTQKSQLLWHPHHSYKKGQIIIVNEALQVASRSFTSGAEYNPQNWEPYTKHNYAIFNPYHTWVEYINRLLGALAGLATVITALISLYFWRDQKILTLLSWLAFFAIGFQAWLGATVVYSVLAPVKITLHTVTALGIVAIWLVILHRVQKKNPVFAPNTAFRNGLLVAFILTLVQIVLGVQVREFIDEQVRMAGVHTKSLWLQDSPVFFYVHRSLSVILVLLNGWLFLQNRKKKLGYFRTRAVLLLLGIEIVIGIVMNYGHFPFGSQAIHLMIATLLFGLQFYLILDSRKKINDVVRFS